MCTSIFNQLYSFVPFCHRHKRQLDHGWYFTIRPHFTGNLPIKWLYSPVHLNLPLSLLTLAPPFIDSSRRRPSSLRGSQRSKSDLLPFPKRCNACKRTDHQRRTHRLCSFNKVTASQFPTATREMQRLMQARAPIYQWQTFNDLLTNNQQKDMQAAREVTKVITSIFNLISGSEIEAA